MNEQIERIKQVIEPLRQQVVNHKLYAVMNSRENLKIFMQYHVFAVWDFMSLLKTLQNNLTCTKVPWFPESDAATRYLINEIVVGEESDVDEQGNRLSHFELYLNAMRQCGADIAQIETFIAVLKTTGDFKRAYDSSCIPDTIRGFMDYTFSIINCGKDYLQAAVFTFGREDLIPGMFHSIINDIYRQQPEDISIFKYYLDRHIEVDGDHHSLLALQMTANLCGSNEAYWREAEQAAIESLQKRIALWDGVYNTIVNQR